MRNSARSIAAALWRPPADLQYTAQPGCCRRAHRHAMLAGGCDYRFGSAKVHAPADKAPTPSRQPCSTASDGRRWHSNDLHFVDVGPEAFSCSPSAERHRRRSGGLLSTIAGVKHRTAHQHASAESILSRADCRMLLHNVLYRRQIPQHTRSRFHSVDGSQARGEQSGVRYP